MLAVGDEDLLSADRVRAIAVRDGLRDQGTDIRTGLRLGQVHRARPLAGDHVRQVGALLLVATVVQQRVDGALGEQRAQRERHVGGAHDLLDGETDGPREAAALVLLGKRYRTPAGLDVLLVRLLEAGRRHHGAVGLAHRTLDVTGAVGGGDGLDHEVGALLQESLDRVEVGVLEAGQRCDIPVTDHVLEHEAEIGQWRTIFAHESKA